MRINRKIAAIAAITAVAAAATGCGDDDSSDGSGTTTANAAAKGPPGDPIVIGAIGSFTGPNASVNGLNDDTLKAWEQATNAAGGINGHPVKVVIKDDAANGTTSARQVKELVEQDKIQALTSTSNATASWSDYVTKAGVPVVGSFSFEQEFTTNPSFYPTGGQLVPMLYGAMEEAKSQGKTKLGILVCTETPVCAQIPPLMKGLASVVGGLTIVDSQKIAQSQPNFTSQCLSAKDKGVDAMYVFQPAPIVVKVAEGCAQQGFTPTQFNISGTTGPVLADSEALEGATITESNPVLADTSAPAYADFKTAMDKSVSDWEESDQLNEENIQVWDAMEALKLALERGKVDPDSAPADVTKGLLTFKQETVGGATPPLTYVKGQPTFVPCWYTTQIQDGEFVAAEPGGKPSCISADKAEQLLAILAG